MPNPTELQEARARARESLLRHRVPTPPREITRREMRDANPYFNMVGRAHFTVRAGQGVGVELRPGRVTHFIANEDLRMGDLVRINEAGYAERPRSANIPTVPQGRRIEGTFFDEISTSGSIRADQINAGDIAYQVDGNGNRVPLGRIVEANDNTITVEHVEPSNAADAMHRLGESALEATAAAQTLAPLLAQVTGFQTNGRKMRGLPEGYELNIEGWWHRATNDEAGRLRIRFAIGRQGDPAAVFFAEKHPENYWQCLDFGGDVIAMRPRYRNACRAAIAEIRRRDTDDANQQDA